MDYKVLLIIAAILVICIAAMRRRLVYELQAASLLLFRNHKIGIALYAILFWPGTILHELSHWLMAEILRVRTGKIEIIPDLETIESGEQRLGSVATAETDPFRSFLIGFAPFFTGVGALVGLGYALNELWSVGQWWQIGLVVYGVITVGNSMIVSRADRRNWPLIAILFALIVYLLYSLGVTVPLSLQHSVSSVITHINQALGLTIGLNLGMIGISYAIRRTLERVTKQKVITRR